MTATALEGGGVAPRVSTFDLRKDSLDHIDAVATYADLWTKVRHFRDSEESRIPEDIADRLDRLYQLRMVRLLRSRSATIDDICELDDHLARVSKYVSKQSSSGSFEWRWVTLRSLLETYRLLLTTERRSAKQTEAPLWEQVGEIVLNVGTAGIRQKDLLAKLMDRGIGPKSKGGVTHLVAKMMNAGWLETKRRGREVFVSAGHVLHERNNAGISERTGSDLASLTHEIVKAMQPTLTRASSRLPLIDHAVSHNQSHCAVYETRGATLHKALRVAQVSKTNDAEVQQHYDELLKFLNITFHRTCMKHFNLLSTHFDNRGHVSKPRLCIKGNLANFESQDKESRVYTILRQAGNSDIGRETKARLFENTGFLEAATSGEAFLLNDIPAAVERGHYVNPRLNVQSARAYWADYRGGRSSAGSNTAWARCWTDFDEVQGNTNFSYQSTLIVPIIFRPEGTDHNDFSRLGLNGKGNNILGFLCFDHEDCNYFDEHDDVHIASVFANLLIPYLVTRLSLTRGSETFEKAAERLGRVEMQHWINSTPELIKTPEIELKEEKKKKSLITMDSTFFYPLVIGRRAQIAEVKSRAIPNKVRRVQLAESGSQLIATTERTAQTGRVKPNLIPTKV